MILVHTKQGVLQLVQMDDGTVQVLRAGTGDVIVSCEEIYITKNRITGIIEAEPIWSAELVKAVRG